ncbi:hypothetical protein BRADI_1g30865v3 [Brachypodium distachyon]|uniref:F-box domain-containing protein n=1 Tax=Brachypodium distachyon TaxID=15368 RepID=A0A0Q3JXR2_BRADI|nr:hypothetical protein BRADI_1g30865v3 [Brachypodium distachyon]
MVSDSESRLTALPDQLVEEILQRLPAPEDLARATAASRAFSRYLKDRGFLARYRCRHGPALLGFLDRDGSFNPALPSHPSAPAARSLASPAADFGFSFLPTHSRWSAMDAARDGRFLLAPTPDIRYLIDILHYYHHHHQPLRQSYVMIPRMSHGVLFEWSTPFFLHPTQQEEDSAAEFSVMWMVQKQETLCGLVFSSRTGQWQEVVSVEWDDLGLGLATRELIQQGPILTRHYAYGVFYWHFFSDQIQRMVQIVLNTESMDLSVRDIVLEEGLFMDERRDLAIVEAGEGRLGLFAVHINHDRNVGEMSELRYFVRRNVDESRSGEWHLVKTIPLGFECHQSIKAATERFLILERGLGWPHEKPADTGYFSVDVKTLKLERFCGLNRNIGGRALIYTNFPPTFLSPPTL